MNEPATLRTQLSTLNILSIAPIVVLTLFCGVVVYLHSAEQLTASDDLVPFFKLALPLTLVSSLALAYFLFANTMKKIDRSIPLKEKIAKYQSAYVVRMGVLEIPGILGAVATLLTGNFYFLGAPLLVVIIFVLFRPSPFAIAEELSLSQKEKRALEASASKSRLKNE